MVCTQINRGLGSGAAAAAQHAAGRASCRRWTPRINRPRVFCKNENLPRHNHTGAPGKRIAASCAGVDPSDPFKADDPAPLGLDRGITSYYYGAKQLQNYKPFQDVISSVTVTLKDSTSQPTPMVVLFNAFMTSASCYRPLHNKLAAAGYAVVQYDVSLLNLLNTTFIQREVALFPFLQQWLQLQTDTASGKLHGKLDLQQLSVAGHSRGGKLAALNFCRWQHNGTGVKACYLVDPVDEFPTKGVDALKQAGSPNIGVSGFGRTGALNPARSNYKHFFSAAGQGSRLQELQMAMHLEVLNAGPLNGLCWVIDRICLLPGAETLVTLLFDFISRQPPQDPQITLLLLVKQPEFQTLVQQIQQEAARAHVRLGPVGDALDLLLIGDERSVNAALRKLAALLRLERFAERLARRGMLKRVASERAKSVASVNEKVAAALLAWVSA